jgi:O-antigen/teichoic acid export membrane protein
MDPLPLRANFSWTLSGMLTYAACQWGMLVMMARLGSSRMVGQFALGLAISGPVMLLANLELRSIVSTDARREYRFQDYLGLRVLTTVLALLVVGMLAGGLGESGETARVIAALGAYKAVEALSDLTYGLFQQQGRNDLMGRSLILRGLSSLAALGGSVGLSGSLLLGVLAMAVAGAVIFCLHDLPCSVTLLHSQSGTRDGDSARPRWNRRILGRLAVQALPLGLMTMLFSLNTNLPSLLLQRKSGIASVGVFAALLSLMSAGHVWINAIGHTVSTRVARTFAESDGRGFGRLLAGVFVAAGGLGIVGFLGALILGRPVLLLLFGTEYAKEAGTLQWLMGAGAASYLASSLSYSMIATRQLKIQPVIMLVSVLMTWGMGLVLIPRMGLMGAAASMLGSSLFQLGANLAVNLRVLSRLKGTSAVGVPS